MTRLTGGLIDRSKPLHFTFNGQGYKGYAGDTLASALLANGVQLMWRIIKQKKRVNRIFMAPSCGTASRARGIPISAELKANGGTSAPPA